MRRGLPYELVGGVRFYERAEIKDLVAYLRLLRNPSDNLAILRVLNQPPRGIGQATRALLLAEADELGGSIWAALDARRARQLPAARRPGPGRLPQADRGAARGRRGAAAAGAARPAARRHRLRRALPEGRPRVPGAAREPARVPHRRPGVHRAPRAHRGRHPDRVSRPRLAGERHRHLAQGPRHDVDDPAQRQGPRVRRRGGRRARGGPAAARQLPRRARRPRRGAAAALRRHDPRPQAPLPRLLPPPPHRRPLPGPGRVALHRRDPGREPDRPREPRALPQPPHPRRPRLLPPRPPRRAPSRPTPPAPACAAAAGCVTRPWGTAWCWRSRAPATISS